MRLFLKPGDKRVHHAFEANSTAQCQGCPLLAAEPRELAGNLDLRVCAGMAGLGVDLDRGGGQVRGEPVTAGGVNASLSP